MTVETFLLTTAVFALALLGLASGVLLGGRKLRGSCGGLSGLCEGCDDPSPECRGVEGPGGYGEMASPGSPKEEVSR